MDDTKRGILESSGLSEKLKGEIVEQHQAYARLGITEECGKKYRYFFDWNDNGIWASYDGAEIKILHVYTLDELPDDPADFWTAVGSALELNSQSEIGMLEGILKEELEVTVTEQNYEFSSIKGYADPDELPFSKEDIVSGDNRQYKIFTDPSGNWFAFASRATKNGRKRIIDQAHLDGINGAYEFYLSEQGVDIKRLARYTEEGRLHTPTKNDFEKNFEVYNDEI